MRDERTRDVSALARSAVVLAGIALIPVPILIGLLGPVPGLLGLAAAIPLSAHLTGLVSFGETPERAWAGVWEAAPRIGQVTGFAAVFWVLTAYLLPETLRAVPGLSVLLSSLFAMSLYLIGMREEEEGVLRSVGVPVLLTALIAVLLISE